jgi:hypothetical protein
LIPLNVCRKKHNYLTWECEHERHVYERFVLLCSSVRYMFNTFGTDVNTRSTY